MECPYCHKQVSQHASRCQACGGKIPAAQYLLEESGIVERRVVAPAEAAPVAVRKPASRRMAKLGDRFLAFLLDTMVLFGVFAVVDAWVFMRWGRVEGTELSLTTAALVIAGMLNAVILFCYGWLLEAGFGATLGKAIVGIRVIRTTQRSVLAATAIRNLLRIVDGFGCYLVGAVVAGCSGLRQRVGDMCAGTAVVEEEFGATGKILALVLWTAALVGAGWAVPRICSENRAQPAPYLNQVVVQVGRTDRSAYFRAAGLRVDVQRTAVTTASGM
jgi:uncharacterized RDD family membrane protein YckC